MRSLAGFNISRKFSCHHLVRQCEVAKAGPATLAVHTSPATYRNKTVQASKAHTTAKHHVMRIRKICNSDAGNLQRSLAGFSGQFKSALKTARASFVKELTDGGSTTRPVDGSAWHGTSVLASAVIISVKPADK